jgi:nucleoside-diphosphate-sugar epimerase
MAGRSRIFVTGGTGFIGGAIAAALAGQHEVVALSRSESGDRALRALGAEPLRGDLTQLEPSQLPTCDAVIHCAAHVEAWGTREETYRINVEGTSRVLAAARAAGAARFVHMSSEAVLWRGQDLVDIDEDHPYPDSTPYLYSETKAEAERRVLAANGDSLQCIVLRPRFVWGPGDRTLAPEILAMAERGAFAWLDGGRKRTSTTHIANLVHATELALARGRGGQVYFVTDGVDTDFRSFVTRMIAAHGVELRGPNVPGWLARPAAALLEGVWRRLGIRRAPPLTRHATDLLCCDCTLRIDKIQRELGYEPVITVETGLAQLRPD